MLSSRSAIICVITATVFAVVCHPRIFFGSGPVAGNIVNLDGVFFLGQWAALVLSLVALVLSVLLLRSANTAGAVTGTAGYSALLFCFQVVTGMPHRANENEWSTGELGPSAFLRGVAKRGKANAKPVQLTAESFAGEWRVQDSTVYTFTNTSVSWTGGDRSGAFSRDACGEQFSMEYQQRERDVLAEYGLPWSTHSIAVHDATPADAKIGVLHVACGPADRVIFIRATENELWRWTNSMDADDFKNSSFVLRRVTPN